MGKPPRNRINLKICLVLAVATLAVYWQTCDFDFCYYDDNIYVADNEQVTTGIGLKSLGWAFTTTLMGNWHPAVWLSYMADTEVAKGLNWIGLDIVRPGSGIYHLTNVLLHTANALLLFLILFDMTGFRWRSAFVAALFALHPLHVESVAWIAERKDVLSTLFWLLTMWAYVKWVRRPTGRNYAWILIAFLLGLMSKAMLVTLPVVLILLDFWPLKRFEYLSLWNGPREAMKRLMREKLPLLIVSVVFCGVAFWAQRAQETVGTMQEYPLWVRLLNAFDSTALYLWKMVCPVRLNAFYTHPGSHIPVVPALAAGLGLAAVTILLVRLRERIPYLAVGWLWYLVTLLPVIGLVQVGTQSMADRYTYIPLVGVFLAIVWALSTAISRTHIPVLRVGIAVAGPAAVVLVMLPATYSQIGVWRNAQVLFSRAVSVSPNNPSAMANYGMVLMNQNQLDQAMSYMRRALRLNPQDCNTQFNLGNSLYQAGRYPEAERELKGVLRLAPDHPYAHMRLGDIYAQRFEFQQSIREYKLALRQIPDSAAIWNSLGAAYAKSFEFREAIRCFRKAIKFDPNNARAQENLAHALERLP